MNKSRLLAMFFKLGIEIIRQLPADHVDLADQLRRAAQSCMQNIGEGPGKRTPADCRKYFDNARGRAMDAAFTSTSVL